MLYPSRHRRHLLPSTQNIPVARRSARDAGQTPCLFSNFSIIGQQLDLCLLFGLLRSSFLLLSETSWYTFFCPSPVLQKLFHHYSEEENTFSSIRSHLSQRAVMRIGPETFLPRAQIFSLGEHVKPVIFLVLPFQRGLERERWGISSTTQQKKPGLC